MNVEQINWLLFLQKIGFNREDFYILIGLSSWAVSGTRQTKEEPQKDAIDESGILKPKYYLMILMETCLIMIFFQSLWKVEVRCETKGRIWQTSKTVIGLW